MSDYPGERPDTDISGMEPEAAKEYVLAFITTLKTTQRQKQEALEAKKLWQDRVRLAEQKQEALLAEKARSRVGEIQTKIDTLKNEERELAPKVDVLKEQLLKLSRAPQMSVDAENLLAQLQMLVGEPDTLSQTFKDEAAKAELEKLKRKMQGGEETP
ncbi:MAG: hypothetical protein P8107_02145 [Spirochaetia bacterium]